MVRKKMAHLARIQEGTRSSMGQQTRYGTRTSLSGNQYGLIFLRFSMTVWEGPANTKFPSHEKKFPWIICMHVWNRGTRGLSYWGLLGRYSPPKTPREGRSATNCLVFSCCTGVAPIVTYKTITIVCGAFSLNYSQIVCPIFGRCL